MSPELISIAALVVIFALATLLPLNIGLLAFVAAFLVGTWVAGMELDEVFGGFPGDLFVTLVGITYLFAIARANGTTDWLVSRAVHLVRGRIALIPWVMFGIGAVLTAIGAVSPAAAAIVAPIALSLAARYRINPLLMGAMVVHGTQAGSFSPISVYGTIVNGIVAREDLPGSPIVLFLGSLVANLLIAAVVFVVFGGLRITRVVPETRGALVGASVGGSGATAVDGSGTGQSDGPAADVEEEPDPEVLRLNRDRLLTVLGLIALVVCTLGFGLHVGLVAMTVSVLLSIVSPQLSKKAPSEVSWPTVLLICGVLTYIGVLEEMGTIDYAGESVARIGVPLLAALLLCYVGAVVSAFASSTALMGVLIPLAVPFLLGGEIGAIGMITGLAVSSTIVDVSPFSTNGAIVVANVKGVDRDRFLRQLMVYGGVVVLAAPLLVWAGLILPGWG